MISTMKKQIRCAVAMLCALLTSNFSNAQTQRFDSVKVDSVAFTKVRAIMNKMPNDNFLKRSYKLNGKEIPYRLLLPKNYNPAKKYPLVITFHNSSRIGNDNESQLEPLSKIWLRDEIYGTYDCLVIAPQFNERSSNYSGDGVLVSKPSDDVKLVLNIMKETESHYQIDQSRIYLVGYSMGGSTAQNLMSMAPKLFAAMVSVAAVPDFSNLKALKNKNMLLIHGQDDTENPYNGSVELFARLKGNKRLNFITYTHLNHNNISIPLLLSEQIPAWLFKQHR